MESLLLQASIYLGAAVLIVPLAVRAGLGSVLGYLAAGIVMGPVLGLAGAETEDLRHYAEFGVVLMLFLVGLELEPPALWAMRQSLVGLGGLQMALTSFVAGLGLLWLGFDWREAVVLGLVAALSSTAIVLQTMTERRVLRTPGGRGSFAVLLAQDIAVVPMLALVPLLTLSPGGSVSPEQKEVGEAAMPIIGFLHSLPGWADTLVMLGVVGFIVFGGHYLTRPVFRYVHASRLPEMGSFIALFTVAGTAFLTLAVGLSPALGTFLAGVVLANSEFRHQLEADIRPYKGILLGLFFMAVGIGIDFRLLAADPWTLVGLTLALVVVKVLVLAALAEGFGLKGRDRWLLTLGLAQAGEFGFVLVGFAAQETILPPLVAQKTLIVVSLSMLVTPLLFLAADWLSRLGEEQPSPGYDPIDEKGRVIIAGIGRFGQVVNRLVRMSGIQTVVLDHDMVAVQIMRRFGVKGFFGDPTRPELLQAAGLSEASVLVVAVDDRENAIKIVRYARHVRPDLHIVARARDRVHVYELFQAGANDIVRETFDSSIRAGRYVLENMGFSEYEAAQRSRTYFRVDRAAMRDLAEIWVPGQPAHLNEAYVARARQLDADLETALLEEAGQVRPDPEAAE
ncbi:cation:proton antiporter domain-containing protein [Rhodobacter sp. NSM]|uniref:cation:proton antiporter domain-containing protein n=1 Tax=Rhodobacter sp. NSM TaxID=3457501 RepID=UPI003FCFCD6B